MSHDQLLSQNGLLRAELEQLQQGPTRRPVYLYHPCTIHTSVALNPGVWVAGAGVRATPLRGESLEVQSGLGLG